MNNTVKDVLLATIPAAIPTLSVLVGILLNQNGISRLEARIISSESRLDGRITGLETRLDGRVTGLDGKLTGLEGRLDGRITGLQRSIEDFGKQLHNDIVMLVGRDTDKSERLARLEERIKS